jgi:hypothetical protein
MNATGIAATAGDTGSWSLQRALCLNHIVNLTDLGQQFVQ